MDQQAIDKLRDMFFGQAQVILKEVGRLMDEGGEPLEQFKQGNLDKDSRLTKEISKLVMIALLQDNTSGVSFARKTEKLMEVGLRDVAMQYVKKAREGMEKNVEELERLLAE